MQNIKPKILLGLFLILFGQKIVFAQSCSTLDFQLQADVPTACSTIAITMIHDALNRPYLYVANKDGGLNIYDVSNLSAPVFVTNLSTSIYNSLDVMNLTQEGNYLYLALGNHFTAPQSGGMAIVDVTDPTSPIVTDEYMLPGAPSGGGIVQIEGNYAYFGAMQQGLIIFDIADKNNIQYVSQFIPDINYPVNSPNADLYNARGMAVKNDIVYLCYDAGGIRIINCVNKSNPRETGRFVNPELYQPFNLPRAYNNLVLNDTLLYVAVDYCGLEILNISDTANITLQGWWNPYNCPNNNWFTSPVHANEIQYDENCQTVFLSTGKSDAMVIDVSNPSMPDSCNFYGGVSNNIGTWGIHLYQNQMYLSYICTLGIPFVSNWTGVKILTYNSCATSLPEQGLQRPKLEVYPNPGRDELSITWSANLGDGNIAILDLLGRVIYQKTVLNPKQALKIDVSRLDEGTYVIQQTINGYSEAVLWVK